MSLIGSFLNLSKLKFLYAANNQGGDQAAIQFANSLKSPSCQIKSLNLKNN